MCGSHYKIARQGARDFSYTFTRQRATCCSAPSVSGCKCIIWGGGEGGGGEEAVPHGTHSQRSPTASALVVADMHMMLIVLRGPPLARPYVVRAATLPVWVRSSIFSM